MLYAVLLVASELATNAVEHARSAFRISAVAERERGVLIIRIEVMDADPRHPRKLPQHTDDVGGRGLRLIDAVSQRWGVQNISTGGKIVFAELLC